MPIENLDGVTFLPDEEVMPMELTHCLKSILAFLKQKTQESQLNRFDDWWEHDGLMFQMGQLDFSDVEKMAQDPESLEKEMPGDFKVKIGICPADEKWYLRYYIDVKDDDPGKESEFDITMPMEWAKDFETSVFPKLQLEMVSESSKCYFARIKA